MHRVAECEVRQRRTGLAALLALRERAKDVLLRIAACTERVRQRRALARLDQRLLTDAGISRCDALREIAKPFWK